MTLQPARVTAGWRAATVNDGAPGWGVVRLRPLTVGELLDDAFELLRSNWRTLVLVVGAVVVPFELLAGFLQRGLLGGLGVMELLEDPTAAAVAFGQTDLGTLEASAARILAALTVFALVEGVVVRVGVSALLGEELTPMQALRATLPRWPALIVAWILVMAAAFSVFGLALALSLIGLFTPLGIVLGPLLLLVSVPVGLTVYGLLRAVPAAVVIEGLGPFAAMARSARLVRPRIFPVLLAVGLALLVGWLVETALATLPTAGGFLFGLEVGWVLVSAGAIAAGLVARPFQALVGALVYVDARVRREGLDLEVRAEQGAHPA